MEEETETDTHTQRQKKTDREREREQRVRETQGDTLVQREEATIRGLSSCCRACFSACKPRELISFDRYK